jgi:hypothetical protein
VSDVDIGFWRAVKIFLKLGLAMIPAVIMLALLNGFAAGFVKAKVR